MNRKTPVPVWDPLVRIFHWSLAISCLVAFVTEDDFLLLHTQAGYVVTGLVLFRVVWGFVGPRHARFGDFVRSPGEIRNYLRSLISGTPRHYLGHNPAGGAMILLMLVVLALVAVTGMATIAADGMGPLAGSWATLLPEKFWEEIHEGLANLMLLLVAIHLAGVAVSSLLHRENLVRAMITGRKEVREEQA